LSRPSPTGQEYLLESHPTNLNQSEYVELTSVVGILFRYRWLIIGITVLAMLAALGVSLVMQPKYVAEVLVIPAREQDRNGMLAMLGSAGGLAGLAGLAGSGDLPKETAKAILESKRFAESFIEDRDLKKVFFSGKWDEAAQEWQVSSPEEAPSNWDAVRYFQAEILEVTEDPRTGLILVSVTWTDPVVAAEWANDLVGRLNKAVQNREIEIARRTIDYLNRELENTSVVELRTAVYGLIEEQIQRIAFASVRDEFAFQVLDPAVVADSDDYVSPNRPLIASFGAVAGLALGFALALLLSFSRQERSTASP
jgi:uncharacterized protein involved in exopolysaccharide biosynthesis